MSHMTNVKTAINSTEDIRACLKDLGYSIVETKTVKGYGGTTVHVEFAVQTEQGGYLIGLRKGGDGNYEVTADWWGVKGVSEKEFLTQLVTSYAERKVRAFAKKKGYRVVEEAAGEGVRTQLLLARNIYQT